MSEKAVTLAVAAFLDSPEAQALDARSADVRKITERLVTLCYEALGKEPRLLDGDDVRALVGQLLPGRFGKNDPLAEQVPDVVRAYVDHLETVQVVHQIFEVRQALDASLEAFAASVRSGDNLERQIAAPQKPFVHKAEKLGRNDPCSCGSGKKYKKCHGKNA